MGKRASLERIRVTDAIEHLDGLCNQEREKEIAAYAKWVGFVRAVNEDKNWPEHEAYLYMLWIEASNNHDKAFDRLREMHRRHDVVMRAEEPREPYIV